MMKRSDGHEFLIQKDTGFMDFNSDEIRRVEMPYCAGLLVRELESMHLSVKLS
jgi:DNA-directed RNA polymerase beta subunit